MSSSKHHVATHDVISQSVLSSAFKKKDAAAKEQQEPKLTVGQIIVKLLKNPSYLFAVYAMTNLKFVVTAL